MNIGIDGRSLQDHPWSGVGQYTFNLLRALFALDRENGYHLFYNAYGTIDPPQFSDFPHVVIHRFRFPSKLMNLSMELLGSPKIDKMMRARSGGLDVFFVPNLNFLALSTRVKLITVAHDLSFEHFPEFFSRKSRIKYRMINPRRFFKNADHVIAVSRHTKGDFVEAYGIEEKKVSVIYPGVNVAQGFRPEVRPVGLSYILYVGALEPRKNIEGLIEAYEMLQTRETLVIAGLATSYVKRLKRRIAQSKLRDQIALKENPSEEEKHALYAGAKIFVYPSFYEGFGFPPLEAMSHGVPVVASSASSVPEVCGDAALLVSPWNVTEIKEGMRLLLEDENLQGMYAKLGKARALQFRWQDCAQNVLQLFRTI